jgi:hypothetical protein
MLTVLADGRKLGICYSDEKESSKRKTLELYVNVMRKY